VQIEFEEETIDQNRRPAVPPFLSSASFTPDEKEKDDRNMDRARWIILAVAVLTVILGIYGWVSFASELKKLNADPQVSVIPEKVVEARVTIVGGLLVGCVFFGLYFWARRNAFAAALVALLIYVADTVLPVLIVGDTRHIGPMRVFVLVLLLKGTHSGWRCRRQARGPGG
jgi:hypothetical protein